MYITAWKYTNAHVFMFKLLLLILHISRHGTWTNQSSKFKYQRYCLGGECWSSELISALGKAKLDTLLLREICLICCSPLLKVSLWNIHYLNHKHFQDLQNPHLSTGGNQSTRRRTNSPTPTRRRIKSSRDVGELVLNPIQLIRS